MIGQIVNYRYEVLEKIGDGSFFSVYKARDKVLNRLVALKVLSRQAAENQEFAAAVVEGYQAAMQLAHPNIVRTLEAENAGEYCYVACEYVRGINVKERVRRAGPMAVPLALDIVIPVLEALEYAHSNRVYHGDLRPQDIIVSPDGEVKLSDFGMSWALDRCPAASEAHPMRSIHYQAPEIAEGAAPSAQSDIYSIGAVLYEMVTSELPFDGATAVSVALKKVKETPAPPRTINAAVPKTLSDAIMKAMEAAPGGRYRSAAEMLRDLRALRESMRTGQPSAAKQEEPPEETRDLADERSMFRTYLLGVLLFVLVVVATGALTLYLKRPGGVIKVPPLLGMKWEDAYDLAKRSGITLMDNGRAYSDIYKEGEICSVIPPVGSTVPSDNPVVKVMISKGTSQVPVPDLTGMTEADALAAISRAGFVTGRVRQQYSDEVPANSVISQQPSPGLMRTPGDTIDLVLSQGPKPPAAQPEDAETSGVGDDTLRPFSAQVEVPAEAQEPQRVLIKVNDSRGETTVYDEMCMPGDKFSVPIETQGPRARIRIYIGGALVYDRYR